MTATDQPTPAQARLEEQKQAWKPWSEIRPSAKGLYRFRLPIMRICGADVAPEWVDKVRMVGMGYAADELWPTCSHWNGYTRSVPGELEWQECLAEDSEGDFWLHGLTFQNCPFTGKPPKLDYIGRYIGAPVWHAERFLLKSGGIVELRQ